MNRSVLFPLIALQLFSLEIAHANSIGEKKQIESSDSTSSLRDKGMGFTENKGQIADREGNLRPDVLYSTDGAGATIYIRKTGISYVFSDADKIMEEIHEQVEQASHNPNELSDKSPEELEHELLSLARIKTHQVNVDFEGANTNVHTEHEYELQGFNNYYYAHCPDGITHVKQYQQIRQKNIYDGIDVVYHGGHAGLKYDIVVQPHADPSQIKMHWKGAGISLNEQGHLVIATSLNEFSESIPRVYQNINGKIVDVEARYEILDVRHERERNASQYSILNTQIQFKLGKYNSDYALVIDPWVTYYGGTQDDRGNAVATDAQGNVYMGGHTESTTAIAGPGAHQAALGGGRDAFLVKFDANGIRLWATYYGGGQVDEGYALATDAQGSVYMGGSTSSASAIASPGAHQAALGGGGNAFLVKFNANGIRLWATYYGGVLGADGLALATDAQGYIYMGGHTRSTSAIASPGAYQTAHGGGRDAFLVKFDANGIRLWATYYGGVQGDEGYALATDAQGYVYMGGATSSTTAIASPGAHQAAHGGALSDAFLVKFDSNGIRLWATYYGGAQRDFGNALATDAQGNVYLGGRTESTTAIAGPGAYQAAYGGGAYDAFLVKFDTNGKRLWATYLGGSTSDYATGLAVDPLTDHVFISGDTYSKNFPVSTCAFQAKLIGEENSFIARFYPNGNIFCSSYFGGFHEEQPKVALFGCYIYMAGYTNGGLPKTPGAYQTAYGGGFYDAFLAQLYKSTCGLQEPVVSVNPSQNNNTACSPCNGSATAQVSSTCVSNALYSYVWSTGLQLIDTNITSHTISGLCAGTYWVKVMSNCNQEDSISYTITGLAGNSTFTTSVSVCSGQSAMIHGQSENAPGVYTQTYTVGGCDSISTITLDVIPVSSNTVTVSSCSSYTHNGQTYITSGIYTQTLMNAAGCDSILTLNLTINNNTNTSSTQSICQGQSALIFGTNQTTSGVYTQTYAAANGCDSISSITLTVYPAVNAAFTASPQPATLLSPTINFINQSTGSVNYYWNFGDNTISSDVNPTHPYEDTGHYQVVLIAANQYGCNDTTEQLIIIGDDFTFFIPNAFTPGNTEPNNSFNGRGTGINKYQLWIYDRWGNMIYTTGETASTEGAVPWDGRANGGKDIAQQDVYVWRVALTDVFGRSHKYVGHVTLLR